MNKSVWDVSLCNIQCIVRWYLQP
uniref:Uncharacterized protein n=1 Tax=Rhizophora mucronata TaxID=61149 RepID=A0A2P2PCY9_RHIMU